VPSSNEYECGECRHRFRTPEGAPHDTRNIMCPACGSIDLNLVDARRPVTAVWTTRATTPASAPPLHTERADS
jgi:DNA-directed RNA polymerase subunit RPC12/RpoP